MTMMVSARLASDAAGVGEGVKQLVEGPKHTPLQSMSELATCVVVPPEHTPQLSWYAVPKHAPAQSRARPSPPHTPQVSQLPAAAAAGEVPTPQVHEPEEAAYVNARERGRRYSVALAGGGPAIASTPYTSNGTTATPAAASVGDVLPMPRVAGSAGNAALAPTPPPEYVAAAVDSTSCRRSGTEAGE